MRSLESSTVKTREKRAHTAAWRWREGGSRQQGRGYPGAQIRCLPAAVRPAFPRSSGPAAGPSPPDAPTGTASLLAVNTHRRCRVAHGAGVGAGALVFAEASKGQGEPSDSLEEDGAHSPLPSGQTDFVCLPMRSAGVTHYSSAWVAHAHTSSSPLPVVREGRRRLGFLGLLRMPSFQPTGEPAPGAGGIYTEVHWLV
jgi:hypothetical protein